MKKTKIYAKHLEPEALEQFESAMEQDFVVQGALMPDAHTWYSLPIWAVVATRWVIVPAWVGYDIWCWMCAVKLPYKKKDIEPHKEKIFNAIYKAIPTWFNHNKEDQEWNYEWDDCTEECAKIFHKNWLKQLCSLWSGNHFIEIWYDEEDSVWIVIHSWSRGIWHAVASHYMRLASWDWKAREWHFWFDVNSQNWKDYITDLNFCLEFALENRKQMIYEVWHIISAQITNVELSIKRLWEIINRNHNHAEEKDWVWIHRKWATHAEEWMMWVIPWNMRDWSFIVKGKWNPDSLYSSSHWAGRVLWRKKAKEVLNLEDFTKSMEWITAKVWESTKDESPLAYKNIFEVMDLQKDLVEVVAHIKPIINIKA